MEKNITAAVATRSLQLRVSGEAKLEARAFTATEMLSSAYEIRIDARSPNPRVDFDSVVGRPAQFQVLGRRSWTGVVRELELVRAVTAAEGASTYSVILAPRLWLLTQKHDHRIFQHQSEVEIATTLLDEWRIPYELRLNPTRYPRRKYRVQYAETDYDFVYRMLSDVGVTFFFEGDTLVLSDAPQRLAPTVTLREHLGPNPLDVPTAANVQRTQRVRPNRVTLRNRSYARNAHQEPEATARISDNVDLELFYYPESFEGDDTARIDLEGKRADREVITLDTNHVELAPGATFNVGERAFLVVEATTRGRFDMPSDAHLEAAPVAQSFRPETTPRPRIVGVDSATVVGAEGEEIDCDELGRVRVRFHWDRRGPWNDGSSCWVDVSQTWGGAGFGGLQVPRVGQEVLVEYLNGDPDRPIVTGRVYTAVNRCPVPLPAGCTKTVLKSSSTGGGGGHCHVIMEDRNGDELMDIRSQKDMNLLVLNDRTSFIGAGEGRTVVRSRNTVVGSHDFVTTKADCVRSVGRNWQLSATGNASHTAANKVVVAAKTNLESRSKSTTALDARQGLALVVGGKEGSRITISSNVIQIQSPTVLINPSAADAAAMREQSVRPDDAARRRDKARKERQKIPLPEKRGDLDRRRDNQADVPLENESDRIARHLKKKRAEEKKRLAKVDEAEAARKRRASDAQKRRDADVAKRRRNDKEKP